MPLVWVALAGLGLGATGGFVIGAGTRTLLTAATIGGTVYVVSKLK